jgi:RNA polymerase sigma-70 factor (sigma-E family)
MEAEAALAAAREGRIAELYARHAPAAGRLAYLLTGNPDVAADIVQDAFLGSISRLGNLRNPHAFGRYLRRAVLNLTWKHWRRLTRQRRWTELHAAEEAPGSTLPPDIETRDEVWRALQALPHDQRAAIVLRYFEDLSEHDAAAVLGCPVGTVKSRVARGLETLRVEMRGDRHERG